MGGHPTRFGIPREEFHKRNQNRSPHGLITTSTHDTKRCEDVRQRLNVLSEIPDIWHKKVTEWSKLNQKHKNPLGPEPNLEYFIYQTLVGAWPHEPMQDLQLFLTRIRNYLYINHNDNYENAVTHFVIQILRPKNAFLKSFISFVEKLIPLGQLNSLSALAIKMASPGVIDIYQGIELWDDSLVDPDNRRAVDFEYRQKLLHNPPLKMHMTQKALHLRKADPDLFFEGEYIPLKINGPLEKHLVAFQRKKGERTLTCIAARFFSKLPAPYTGPIWKENFLEYPLAGKELFTGKRKETNQIEKILSDHSVALITNFEDP